MNSTKTEITGFWGNEPNKTKHKDLFKLSQIKPLSALDKKPTINRVGFRAQSAMMRDRNVSKIGISTK